MWRLECSLRCAGRAPRGRRIYKRFRAVVEDIVVYKIYECGGVVKFLWNR